MSYHELPVKRRGLMEAPIHVAKKGHLHAVTQAPGSLQVWLPPAELPALIQLPRSLKVGEVVNFTSYYSGGQHDEEDEFATGYIVAMDLDDDGDGVILYKREPTPETARAQARKHLSCLVDGYPEEGRITGNAAVGLVDQLVQLRDTLAASTSATAKLVSLVKETFKVASSAEYEAEGERIERRMEGQA